MSVVPTLRVIARHIDIDLKETATAKRGHAGAEVYREKSAAYRHDPDVGSQSADPIKFCFRKSRSWRVVLSILRETVFGYYPTGHDPKEDFNGGGTVVSYLNDKGDNDEPYGNSISGVRAIQRVRICPHSHESHVRTDPIFAVPSVVSHPKSGSP